MIKCFFKVLIKIFLLLISALFLFPKLSFAVVDPSSVPNNKFGIHIISATVDEASDAASLVNSNGDWGYITVLIESKDRNKDKWQQFFDELRRKHLIPIVRLATQPDGGFWKRPYEGEEQAWADFLDNLNWPVKNRYVVIYNEPNHAAEWDNQVDAKLYAQILDKTITALKNKNSDFFVLNAGFDASAPSQPPRYEDELIFISRMNEAVPGIFDKLDGWVSHSYPNPGFVGSPDGVGRGTVRTWVWELQKLKELGVTKNLPVFITETGWKHAEGLKYEPFLPSSETVGDYYKTSFDNAWNNNQVVAVTPFLLNYQESLFDSFSFKRIESQSKEGKFYPQYQILAQMPKIIGKPFQENKAQLVSGEIFSSVVAGEIYKIALTFKNTGQSIWNDHSQVKLIPIQGGRELGVKQIEIPKERKTEPGKSYDFEFFIKAPQSGVFKTIINLFEGEKQFDSGNLEFTTEVKPPVILQVTSSLKWKKRFGGIYLMNIKGPLGNSSRQVVLGERGISEEFEARDLLPDYTFDFSLERKSEESGQIIQTYKPNIVRQALRSGLNIIDFGELEPVLFGNLIHPRTLWSLLPFSN